MKTSGSHPIQIASIGLEPDHGRVGLTFCPGKYDPNDGIAIVDLDAIRDWGGRCRRNACNAG
jgi:ADP-ribosyl-[dinitrogen reductase] hydrolase